MGAIAQLCGTAISLYCAQLAGKVALDPSCAPGPWGIPMRVYGLAALVLIAIPTSFYQLRKLGQAMLAARGGSR